MDNPIFLHLLTIIFLSLPVIRYIRQVQNLNLQNMKKTFTKILCVAIAALSLTSAAAQQGYEKDNEIFRLGVEARFDYLNEALDGNEIYGNSGFKVRYFNLRMDGQIAPKFSYSWRQRFSRPNTDGTFVNNTDWLNINYKATDNWSFNAGKQVVWIGGWEYDRAPIEIYYCSEYWNNVNCFQLGASATYTTNKANESFTFQICQSPYNPLGLNGNEDDLYAYNLYYFGSHGCYKAIHSVNLVEYQKGKFDAYFVLGNQFKFGNSTLELDFMNRGTTTEEFMLKNYSIMAEFSQLVAQRVNLFAKVIYDKAGADAQPLFVYPNTDLTRIGGGIEYYPMGHLGNRDVRLHAAYVYNTGKNHSDGVAKDKGSFFTFGLTWKIDALQGLKAALK